MQIELLNLLWLLFPVAVVGYFYIRYTYDKKSFILAFVRMFSQLLLIGYLLVFIFDANSNWIVLLVLFIMMTFASIISLRPLQKRDKKLYQKTFISIFVGGFITLCIVVFGVLELENPFNPKVVIPLAGMVFANSMNTLSLFLKSYEENQDMQNSFKLSLIPIINSFFAVGLVSLPGMMTGQILSGVDPLIAVRYQIMVMLMILSSSGISLIFFVTFLTQIKKK